MTEWLRNQNRPTGRFSQERRSDAYGGRIPAEWKAQAIDLDALTAEIDGAPCLIGVGQSLWVQWDKVPFRLLSIVETKNPGEQAGSYVTFELARLSGLPGYCVTLFDDQLHARRNDGEERVFDSVEHFVYATHVLRRETA